MASGVGVDELCINAFQELKLKKKFRYILYKLSEDNKTIIIEKQAEPSTPYDTFLQDLPKDDCRYAIYDFQYELPGEGVRSKICFFAW
jgi:cofilin